MIRLLATLLLVLQGTTLSVRTELVALPVTVTDPRGRRVTGLTRDNFRIYEDGRSQPVSVFHHGDGPVTLGLIVDHSASMRPNFAAVIGALSAFARVRHADDEMFVVDFNDRVTLPLVDGKPFTNNAGALRLALLAVPPDGKTALYDAVMEGLKHLKLGRWDKRTLIVVSDGGDNASQHTYSHVETLARQSDAVIYSIGLLGDSYEEEPKLLKRLSRDTGGVAYFPRAASDVADVLNQIVGDLREQYTLGFVPEARRNGPAFRKLEVIASAPGLGRLRVRTRSGYLSPDDTR